MNTFHTLRYQSNHSEAWNDFVANSKNATFLFHRNFMEYHQNRFEDFSLMIYKNNALVALLPANLVGDNLYSHQGLTYGGLVLSKHTDYDTVNAVWISLFDFLGDHNIKTLTTKSFPEFYCTEPSGEVYNILKTFNTSLVKQHTILAIDYNSGFKIHKTKVKRYKKLLTNGFTIKEGSVEFKPFWNTILMPRLKEKHQSKPVHSLAEIQDLQRKFQYNILQYCIYKGDEILAGITIFKKGKVIKSQYGMATTNGEQLNALDMLFVSLIHKFRDEGMQYFSMGTVNDSSKLGYSKGMLKQKQELGCRVYQQDLWKTEIND